MSRDDLPRAGNHPDARVVRAYDAAWRAARGIGMSLADTTEHAWGAGMYEARRLGIV